MKSGKRFKMLSKLQNQISKAKDKEDILIAGEEKKICPQQKYNLNGSGLHTQNHGVQKEVTPFFKCCKKININPEFYI